jgi:serine/threonine protein kinase
MDAYPVSHPTDQTLTAYGLGQLDDGSASAVDRHLERCAACRKRVAEMSADRSRGRGWTARGRLDSPARDAGLSMREAGPRAVAPPSALALPPGLADHPDYQVLRELGRGGMAVVYLAENTLLGRKEVLKVVGGHIVSQAGVLDRFLREIRTAAHLRHPNIVTAYSAFRLGDSLVLAMEYVEGPDLSRMVQANGPLPIAQACHFVAQAAMGLQHAHEHGLVHRDIKPANLILALEGKRAVIRVLDFGLAKVTRERRVDSSLTCEGQMLGTPDFIAPEQIRNSQSADIRADIYSLGCTLYFLLTGGPPFVGDNLWDLYQAHLSMDADPLNRVRPEVPAELAALVAKMMAKPPQRRFQGPADVAQALVPFFQKGRVASVRSKPDTSPAGQPVAKRTAAVAAAAPTQPAPSEAPAPSPPVRTPDELATAGPRWESLIAIEEPGPLRDPGPIVEKAPRRGPRWMWPMIVAAAVVGGITTGIIIYVTTDHGRVRIVVDDPKAIVQIDGIEIPNRTPHESITLRAGAHVLAVQWRDGHFETRQFVVRRGDDEALRVAYEPIAVDRAETKGHTPPWTETASRDPAERPAAAPPHRPPMPTALTEQPAGDDASPDRIPPEEQSVPR